MKTIKIQGLLLLLFLMTVTGEIRGADGITTIPYYMDFSSGTEPFDGGSVVSGTNVAGVFRVTNSTATASFANTHTLNSNETVKVAFTAYHGYLNNNSTSSVQIVNTDGVVLAGYTYNHTLGQIVDVTIGGVMATNFTMAFDAASYVNDTQRANGLVGGDSGKPYLDNDNYSPNITMSVKGDGTATLTVWIGSKSSWNAFYGSLTGLKLDLASLRIVSNCNNDDRTICIDKLNISSNCYNENYDSGNIDWTTGTGDRYTPVVLEESGNRYLSVNQEQRNNNGTTLTSNNLGMVAGSSYQMTFDLKLGSSNNQSPTSFTIHDATDTGTIFSLTATGVSIDTWYVNGTNTMVTLPGSNSYQTPLSNIIWVSVTILRNGMTTWISIKNRDTNADILTATAMTASSTGGLGTMQFVSSRYYANFAIDNIDITPILDWSTASTTINIKDVANTNPNTHSSLPYIHTNYNTISSRSSSNTNVATFWGSDIHIKGVGTTILTVTDASGYIATTTLTVTGTQVAPAQTNNTLSFDTEGYIVNNASNNASTYTLSTGLQIDFGYSGETSLIVRNGSYNVLKIIDANGFSHPNLASSGLPYEGIYGGTFVKLSPTNSGYLTVTGNVSTANTKLYNSTGTQIDTDIDEDRHTLSATLTGGTIYFLYNQRTSEEEAAGIYTSLVNSISFANPLFVSSTAVIEIPSDGNYTIPAVGNMTPTSYTLTPYGDLAGAPLTASGGIISGINAGGAILVELSDGTSTAYHLVTVAYKATTYPGHFWNFNLDGEYMTTPEDLKTAPVPTTTITASDNNSWTALYKVSTGNYTRAPEWRLNRRIENDNAVVVPETAGLLFSAKNQGFYLRNDNETFRHIGIHNRVASDGVAFTIPYLKAGDIVELNWKHDAGNSGSVFSATNLKDLRNKIIPTDDTFLITESAYRSQFDHPGRYSFIVAADGDVTFTLKDAGYTDILSIRIYEGPYRSTMHNIDLSGGDAAPTEALLDNIGNTEDPNYKQFTYNYCNPLYSTATGPAMYVIKGYEAGKGFNRGVDADRKGDADPNNLNWYVDPDAYPVDDAAELARLINLRKNLVGLKVENHPWKSNNNAYNNGYIAATSGWGKVTVRMNNYTNDMKYVIGYTPDYTITFGSAPHQKYPYTWDFTHISAQQVTGLATNAYNSIRNDWYTTNWDTSSEGVSLLNVDNSGDTGSQYVPGAILVTTERALSKYSVPEDETALYALDELDGLGVNGQIAIHGDLTQNASRTRATIVELLKYNLDDGFTATTELTAGSGTVYFGADKYVTIDHSQVDATNVHSYQLDGGGSKYIRLTLPYGVNFEAGNTITIKAYSNKANGGVTLHQSAETDSETNANLRATLTLANKYAEETLTYTVSAGDGIEGQHQVWIYRANGNTTFVTEMSVKGTSDEIPVINKMLYAASETTLTIPDLNADGKQDWIYVSASAAPTAVTNATIVTSGTDGPDANQSPELEDSNAKVYKYKVDGNSKINAYLTFAAGTKIYKIGVTHILKEIHPVGGVGWATESRNHHIDHSLIGYFTKNDVNAYTVRYDSYDMKTATVALTPINEDGYVPEKTGIVMKLDNTENLSDANSGKYVPLFYPSYTLGASSTAVNFPDNNWMYQKEEDIDRNNRNYREVFDINSINYTKFILTNKYWTFNKDHAPNTDESAESHTADAAGFYRMHIWKTTGDADEGTKNTMPSNSAFLLVPSDNLPVAVWTLQLGYSAARGDLLGVYNIIGPGSETAIEDVRVTPEFMVNDYNTDGEETWYTVSGMKLSTRPTQPGLYIYNNRKVVIK